MGRQLLVGMCSTLKRVKQVEIRLFMMLYDTSLCHRSGFTGNGSRDAHCFIGETSDSVFCQNEFCMEKSDFEVYLPEA